MLLCDGWPPTLKLINIKWNCFVVSTLASAGGRLLYFPSSLEFHSLLCILGNFGRKFGVYVRVCVRVGVASARSHGQLWKHVSALTAAEQRLRCCTCGPTWPRWAQVSPSGTKSCRETNHWCQMIFSFYCLFGYSLCNHWYITVTGWAA